MPSQDDFLNELLKDVNGQDGEFETIEGLDDLDLDSFFGVEDTQEMSEADIEKMLFENQETAEKQEQVQQAETSEAVDEDIMALLQEASDEVAILEQDDLGESIENLFAEEAVGAAMPAVSETELQDVAKDAAVKKSKEELKAEKTAAKEAKKAEKAAKKAEKAAQKKAKKQKSNEGEAYSLAKGDAVDLEPIQEISEEDLADTDDIAELDVLADLDELLSLAGNTVKSTGGNQEQSASLNQEESKDSLVEGIVAEKKAAKKAEKKGLWARLVDLLTEEDEEESQGNEEIKLSEENKTVIEELDKNKKKKPKKEKKGKKDKKADAAKAATDGEEENAEEGAEEQKGKKSKKEKKPKKEKVITQEMLDEQAREEKSKGKKMPFKKVLAIMMVCLSVGFVIMLLAGLSGDYSAKKAGREAFYAEDYEAVYQNLYGRDLNETEQVMYSKAESILRIRLWIREYEMFVEEGEEAEALDSLIQSIGAYPVLFEYASKWNAGTEVAELYAQITGILSEKYHLSEVQALEINSVTDDEEYSRRVYAIIDGDGYGSWEQTKEEKEAETLKDILPEEEELGDVSFVDNN